MPDGPLLAQFTQIAHRAFSAGRPLREVPELRLGSGSTVWFDGERHATVQLDAAVGEVPSADRAWTMAHELSHVLRIQERRRPPLTPAVVTLGVVAVLLTVAAVTVPVVAGVAWPSVLAVPGLAALWLCRLALQRTEEREVDVTAAAVFGEVLSPEGVARVARQEGWLSALVPGLARSHDKPAKRRSRGLAAVGTRTR